MDFIIFDLEATCWEGNTVGREQEIIEIGALRLDAYGDVLSTFQRFVRPLMNPQLSVYCRKLTNITQENVDRAGSFEHVIQVFSEWLDTGDDEVLLCSWGGKDQEFFSKDMALHQVSFPWLSHYIDLKEQYHEIKGLVKKQGLKKVLDKEGLAFEGNQHRALDDATNLCFIFRKYLDLWMF